MLKIFNKVYILRKKAVETNIKVSVKNIRIIEEKINKKQTSALHFLKLFEPPYEKNQQNDLCAQ